MWGWRRRMSLKSCDTFYQAKKKRRKTSACHKLMSFKECNNTTYLIRQHFILDDDDYDDEETRKAVENGCERNCRERNPEIRLNFAKIDCWNELLWGFLYGCLGESQLENARSPGYLRELRFGFLEVRRCLNPGARCEHAGQVGRTWRWSTEDLGAFSQSDMDWSPRLTERQVDRSQEVLSRRSTWRDTENNRVYTEVSTR